MININKNKIKLDQIRKIINNSNFLNNFSNEDFLFIPIPNIKSKEDCKNKIILESLKKSVKEPLISLNKYNKESNAFFGFHNRIKVSPIYFKQNIKGSLSSVFVRESLLNSLLKIIDYLPEDYGIIVYDGYRPISVQQKLYDDFYEKTKNKIENQNKSQEELFEITKRFVSLPLLNPKTPPTHNTGGAIDFSICDKNGKELNYLCEFDDFNDIANTRYFEEKYANNEILSDLECEAMLNRRVLAALALKAGFQLYKEECWHFDKNNQWDVSLDEALYGSCDLNGVYINFDYNIKNYIMDNLEYKSHLKYIIE